MSRTYLFALLVLFFTIKSYAQNEFPPIEFGNTTIIDQTFYTNTPSSVYSADLDGDGDMDVLSSSMDDDRIAWYENLDGFGTFSRLRIISDTVDRANSVYAADIDGDGDLDVLSAGDFQNEIAWYENTDGLGSFSAKREIVDLSFNQDYAYEILAADMDNDGDMDVVSSGSDGLAWYENTDGQGNFTINEIGLDNQLLQAFSVYTEDLDGDGDLDILSASSLFSASQSRVVWYENLDGDGTFSSENLITNSINRVIEVFASDIDNDGNVDVLFNSSEDNTLFWAKNLDGEGNFGAQQVIWNGTSILGAFYATDIDDDGFVDVVSGLTNGNIAWFKNSDGLGNFDAPQTIANNTGGAQSIFPSDIDGDGNSDLVIAEINENLINWYQNTNGQGNFGGPQPLTYSANSPAVIYSVDIDGDNDLDVISASRLDKKINWYENLDGQGDFSLPRTIFTYDYSAVSVFSSDFDGDGDMDIVASGDSGELISFVNSDGEGNFIIQQTLTNDLEIDRIVFAADLDNDGLNDVISISAGNNKVSWFKSIDSGFFGTEQIISDSMFFVSSVDSADMDGDNDLDIIVSSVLNDRVSWFENTNGQGNFSSEIIISNSINAPASIRVSDIDGDDDLDIVTVTSEENKIYWFQNMDGQGNFSASLMIANNPFGIKSLDITDLDNDGDMDIISSTTSFQKREIQWYENLDANGTFGNENKIVNITDEADFIISSDINNDGLNDILFMSTEEDKIAWLDNKGKRNIISGRVRLDTNTDGCDANDLQLPNFLVVAEGANDSFATFTQANGVFEMTTLEGNYQIEINYDFANYLLANPTSHNADFTTLGNTDSDNDFCIEAMQTIDDLSIILLPLNEARPGFNSRYQVVFKNNGTSPIDGTINVQFDGTKLTYLFTDYFTTNETANSLTTEFFGLNPFESRSFSLEFNVMPPPIVNSDDLLQFTSEILPNDSDNTPEDNTCVFDQIVVNSFDPNDKIVLQGESIFEEETDNYLDYIVRFQNTGTASAIKVRIADVLDANLDWSTLQPIASSHNYRVQITNENLVEFIFDNINLPPQIVSEEQSQGFVAFKIKPKSDVQVGDVFSGVAAIYFDFNTPIITNTVTTEIVEPLSVEEYNTQSIKLYPNPANNKLEITSIQTIDQLTIIDINGRVLKSLAISNLNYSLDVSSFSKGVYFLEIQSGESKSTRKFIKN